MRTLSRICSILMSAMLCLSLVSGCAGGTSNSGSATNDVESVQEENADAEAETAADDGSYTAVTISTYDVDDSGNQELSGEKTLDAEGNVLGIHAKGTLSDLVDGDYEYEDYEYSQSWSYNSDGLICEYEKEYIYTELYVDSETAEYEYQYDTDGTLDSITCTDIELYPDGGSFTRTVIADITYNTEGSVASINIWFGQSVFVEDGEEEVDESEYTSDSFVGLVVEFTYYFDQITGMDISYGSCVDGVVECAESEDGPYSRSLECNDEGLITTIESGVWQGDVGYPTSFIPSIYGGDDCVPQLFYRALEYVDILQGTQLAPFGSYLLYGTYQLEDEIRVESQDPELLYLATYHKIMVDYDGAGNKTSQTFYQASRVKTTYKLSYAYEYDYDEYGRVSTRYESAYEDGDLWETYVSYYEYA